MSCISSYVNHYTIILLSLMNKLKKKIINIRFNLNYILWRIIKLLNLEILISKLKFINIETVKLFPKCKIKWFVSMVIWNNQNNSKTTLCGSINFLFLEWNIKLSICLMNTRVFIINRDTVFIIS